MAIILNVPVFVVVFLTVIYTGSASESLEKEIENNDVTIRLYDATLGSWNANYLDDKLKKQISENCTRFCNSNLQICGLANTVTFTDDDVVIDKKEQSTIYLLITFYVKFPSGVSLSSPKVTEHVLKNNTVVNITISVRDTLNDILDYFVLQINDEQFLRSQDWTLNIILIPSFFLVVIILGLLVVILRCHEKLTKPKTKPQKFLRHDIQINNHAPNNNNTTTPVAPVVTPTNVKTSINEVQVQPKNAETSAKKSPETKTDVQTPIKTPPKK